MAYAKEMLDTHPRPLGIDALLLARCIEACAECAATCTMCADMCVGEEDVAPLLRCVRVDLDCAAVCTATVSVVSRRTEPDPIVTRTVVAACAELCGTCAEECERHAAHHAHCRVNAATCRRCEQACQALLGGIG